MKRVKSLGSRTLEAGVSKLGSEIGTRAANKVISTVDDRFSKSLVKSQNLINPQKNF